MKIIISTERVPIKMWLDDAEVGALEQARNLARLPFMFKHVALMPDCHQGYGMPIGGVIATKGVVIPNAVGVDIGCGMSAVKTNLTKITKDQIKAILGGSKELQGGIRSKIPLGFNKHSKKQEWDGFYNAPTIPVIQDNIENAKKQLGTLGGGNHFIEIQKGDDGHIWIMIHSGSRNLGYQIAKHYNKLAQDLCKKWHSNIPDPKGEDGLAFLPLDSDEGKEYMVAMNFALDFAYENRMRMIKACLESFKAIIPEAKCEHLLNIHHNFASIEHHFGSNVVVHRKGATSAKVGQNGIIPGSQGTSSYIVQGLGNPESFNSCSHGAGRKMSRTKARNELSLENEQKILDDKGIVHAIRGKDDLDEASSAYKDIDEVMENQKDLVKIIVKLNPLAVIKG